MFLAGRELEARSGVDRDPDAARGPAGASIALAKKPVPPATAAYITVSAAAHANGGIAGRVARVRLRIGTARAAGQCGSTPEIIGTYLIKFMTPGALGVPGDGNAMDQDSLRDVVLQVGYRLATPGG